jgi:hypothetical protein
LGAVLRKYDCKSLRSRGMISGQRIAEPLHRQKLHRGFESPLSAKSTDQNPINWMEETARRCYDMRFYLRHSRRYGLRLGLNLRLSKTKIFHPAQEQRHPRFGMFSR